jgi:hypothetical protein
MLVPVSELMLRRWMCDCQEWIDELRPIASHFTLRAYSIPDEVIEFFNWPNPSSHTMAPGSTQPLTEMSTRNIPEGKGWRHRNLWVDYLENVGALTSHNPMGLHDVLQKLLLLASKLDIST